MATLIGSTDFETAGSAGLVPGNDPTVTVTGSDQSILVWVQQGDALARSFTVSSSLDGALPVVAYDNPSTAMGVWLLRDASVGTHALSVVASASGVSFSASAQVVEDLGTDTPVSDTQFATSNGLSHVSGATGVTTGTGAFVLCVCSLTGTVTTKVPGAGFTALAGPSATSGRFAQYRDSATALTAEQGAFTTTGTNRANRGLIVAFPVAPGDPVPTASGGAFTAWFGR